MDACKVILLLLLLVVVGGGRLPKKIVDEVEVLVGVVVVLTAKDRSVVEVELDHEKKTLWL